MDSRRQVDTARRLLAEDDPQAAVAALSIAVTTDDDLATWLAVDRLMGKLRVGWARRQLRVAVLSSHTGGQFTAALRVAGLVHGMALTTYESGYRTFEQEIVDPESGLYRFEPHIVVIAADQREVRIPEVSVQPEVDLAAEVDRWARLWTTLGERSSATIVQLSFVPPLTDALGAYGAQLPGGRRRLIRRLNLDLTDRTTDRVHLVDAEAVAYAAGERVFAEPRYWFRSKHAIGLGATTVVARAVADTVAAVTGMGRKLVVLDLDNTLWGGVIGEDGIGGIVLGEGPTGEAFVEFQHFLSGLRERGLLLAVCSKNNVEDARLPFEQHPDMVLELGDFVAFEASWSPKPQVIAAMAQELDLGLESIVFVDDNPAERAAVRHALPEVGVVELPSEPSGYIAAVAAFPGLQTVTVTDEDRHRTAQYRARSQARALEETATSRQDYLAGLEMTASAEPLMEGNRNRIVQLIGKTNQFNLTGRRHSAAEVDSLDSLPRSVVWGVRVADRFDRHGLVSVLIATPDVDDTQTLVIDTFVMSCRVLGRTVEQEVLGHLTRWAETQGFSRIVGVFIPTSRNTPAASVLPEAGFRRLSGPTDPDPSEHGPVEWWEFVVGRDQTPTAGVIQFTDATSMPIRETA